MPDHSQEFRGEILQTRRVENFRLVAVDYASNQVLPLHSHRQAYVSVALYGGYLEQLRMRSWECTPGGTIFHASGESHENRFFEGGARLLVLEIDPPFLSGIEDRGIATNHQWTSNHPQCMYLALRLSRALHQTDALSALCAEGLSLELLCEALQGVAERRRGSPGWLSRVREILHDRYCENISLGALAREVQVHPVHLARTFREHYHCSMGDFVRKLRVEAACRELLHSDTTIAEIAVRTGFTDQSHLSRVLKRHTGVPPGEFRRTRQPA
jgi:AraC family transcriptional regulator